MNILMQRIVLAGVVLTCLPAACALLFLSWRVLDVASGENIFFAIIAVLGSVVGLSVSALAAIHIWRPETIDQVAERLADF